ncbi:MAG: hypothetical protein P8O75_03055 [Gammaproteobacteria bacterium]|nr:hypothetical protein [Gammaproteobacteria bacterium]
MKVKSKQVTSFISNLHKHIVSSPQFRKDTSKKSESVIQGEIRPLIVQYLEKYFQNEGYKDYTAKANKSFYWEGQEGSYGKGRATTFASRNYPDFIIMKPYLLAIEYKQGKTGSLVKQAIGQSLMHTLSGDFDFVYVLFHDENKDKKIEKSVANNTEEKIINKVWKDFNVLVRFT